MNWKKQPQFIFTTLSETQQKEVEEWLEEAWPTLVDLGARSLTLVHLGGQLITWKSLDGYQAAARMGRAAVKDLILTRRFNALVHAALEPGIRMTYERGTDFNPAQAAGIHVVSSTEVLIHQVWLLVIGWTFDGQQ